MAIPIFRIEKFRFRNSSKIKSMKKMGISIRLNLMDIILSTINDGSKKIMVPIAIE